MNTLATLSCSYSCQSKILVLTPKGYFLMLTSSKINVVTLFIKPDKNKVFLSYKQSNVYTERLLIPI